MSNKTKNRVAVVGGARTPFAKAGSALKAVPALDLATHAVNGALTKLDLDPNVVDQLVYGTVIVDPTIPHLAREVNFKSELPADVQSLTVTDNCISGTSAIASVHDASAWRRIAVMHINNPTEKDQAMTVSAVHKTFRIRDTNGVYRSVSRDTLSDRSLSAGCVASVTNAWIIGSYEPPTFTAIGR